MKRKSSGKNVKKETSKKVLNPSITKETNDAILSSLSARKAKTHKGRKVLEAREPQVHEEPKTCLFTRGTRCQPDARALLTDLYLLRKPYGTMLGRKQEGVDMFRDTEPLEYLTRKNNCALFCHGATNKQRPFRLIFGRTFENTLLDMYEVHIRDYVPLKNFAKKLQTLVGSKPLVIAEGAEFESSELMKYFRNYLLDFFSFGRSHKLLLKGIDQLIVLTAIEGPQVLFRRYRLSHQRLPGCAVPDVTLDEIGPSFTMSLERHQLPDHDAWKAAIKLPKEIKSAKVKNVSTTVLGETLGRVHVGTQDFTKLNTHHYHGRKQSSHQKGEPVPTSESIQST